MVRAIREGRKTQTRRIAKEQRHPLGYSIKPYGVAQEFLGGTEAIRCPYGQPGDRLWVRETWGQHSIIKPSKLLTLWYRSDGDTSHVLKWRPPIHMPRWASRITLEIVSVRVERLNNISEDDAKAEGVEPYAPDDGRYVDGYKSLWESINGPESWDLNPWVWVVEFKEVKP